MAHMEAIKGVLKMTGPSTETVPHRKRAVDVPLLDEVTAGHGSCTCEVCWVARAERRRNRALSVEEKHGGGVVLSGAESAAAARLAELRRRYPA